MFKLNRLLSLGFHISSNLITGVHNKYFVNGNKNCLAISNLPGSNLGLELCDYLSFSKLLDTKTGKLKIPKWAKQIKIDIGLSFAAPNSALWLDNLSDRIVFGFEPNPENVQELLTGDNRKRGGQFNYVNLKYINNRFFIFNAAIDNCSPQYKDFYITRDDPGTSSLHKPSVFWVKEKTIVPCIPLSAFLSLVPWNRFKYIEHIKIDTQGNDLRVLQSVGNYLNERVVFVTAECTAKGYSHTHTKDELDKFMASQGFKFIKGTDNGGNKTYINKRFQKLKNKLDYSTENR